MRYGLDFVEEYEDAETSDVLQMLFGRGQRDMAAFAADRPLAAPPGTRFNYSSGTSNIIVGIVASIVGPGEPYRRFLDQRLFGPLGMASAIARFDGAGTWVAASYVYASARHYARFGLLYLRGNGVWRGRRLLPEGMGRPGPPALFGRSGRTVTTTARTGGAGPDHSRHLLGLRPRGPVHRVCPGLDLVLVRMGRTDADPLRGAEGLAVHG